MVFNLYPCDLLFSHNQGHDHHNSDIRISAKKVHVIITGKNYVNYSVYQHNLTFDFDFHVKYFAMIL